MHGEKIVNKIVFPKKKQNNFPIMEETIAVMEKKSFIMEKTKWFIFSKIKNITCEWKTSFQLGPEPIYDLVHSERALKM